MYLRTFTKQWQLSDIREWNPSANWQSTTLDVHHAHDWEDEMSRRVDDAQDRREKDVQAFHKMLNEHHVAVFSREQSFINNALGTGDGGDAEEDKSASGSSSVHLRGLSLS